MHYLIGCSHIHCIRCYCPHFRKEATEYCAKLPGRLFTARMTPLPCNHGYIWQDPSPLPTFAIACGYRGNRLTQPAWANCTPSPRNMGCEVRGRTQVSSMPMNGRNSAKEHILEGSSISFFAGGTVKWYSRCGK